MDHDSNNNHLNNARNTTGAPDRDEDQHDAMEVDGGPSMMIDTNQSHEHEHRDHHGEADSRLVSVPLVAAERPANETSNESLLPSNQAQNQSLDLGATVGTSTDATRTATPVTREPPAFDEDTERPRQRRRFHVTVEDDIDPEIRTGVDSTAIAEHGPNGATEDEDIAVLESAPPRMSDLSIATPTVEGEQAPMLDVVPDSAPAAQADPPVASAPHQGAQSPHINTIPLPDVQPPNAARLDPVMEAARRLTTTPDANSDQMQADLALLAPYIAAQAMAAAFPFGGGRPPPGGGPNTGGGPPGPRQATGEGTGETNANEGAPPPPQMPFPFVLPPFLFGGGSGELPPDPKRAERLANGLKVVEDGLLKRWKDVCGEEGAVCAVCYGELLEEPGIEKEKENEKEDKGKGVEVESDVTEKGSEEEDAHAQALRDALKRREQMEKEEKEELEHKLETAVLAFPCGHVFHRTCLLPWLSRHTTCPACRFDIDPKSDTLNLPADDAMPFTMSPNGFNFGDFFTVGPVLRVPRAQAPGPRSQRWPRAPNPNPNGAPGPRAPRPDNAGPPSMTDLLDDLFGPLLHSAAFPPQSADQIPPRQPPAARRTRPARENAEPAPPSTTTAPPDPPISQDLPNSPRAPTVQNNNPSPNRTSGTRRRENSDRPVAMFGRITPRRPPQPITPAWMRPPARATGASSSAAPQPTPAAPSSSEAGPSATSEPTSAAGTEPPTPVSVSSGGDTRAGFSRLRDLVADLLPNRLSSNGRAADAPVPSNTSIESNSSAPTVPASTRAGLRAMLRESTARIRDFAGNRRSSGGSNGQIGASAGASPTRQSADNDMPALESDSDDGSQLSEDAAHDSGDEDDMPGLEPINDPMPMPIRRQDQPPPPSPSEHSDRNSQVDDNERPLFGPPRPPGQDMMDNIITLRIDLGHADGRDETIIVPLLFNPNGRTGTQPQAGDAPAPAPAPGTASASAPAAAPAPPHPRASPPPPPPMKKWTPPEAIKTFRQVVEEKEREVGWRCDDPQCLLGPCDDDEPVDEHIIVPRYPIMRSEGSHEAVRHKIEDGIRVYADGEDVRVKGENPVCDHTLHAECLVKSARVNGWGPEHNSAPSAPVTLKCPMCRAVGNVNRQVWDEGVMAEEAGEQLN